MQTLCYVQTGKVWLITSATPLHPFRFTHYPACTAGLRLWPPLIETQSLSMLLITSAFDGSEDVLLDKLGEVGVIQSLKPGCLLPGSPSAPCDYITWPSLTLLDSQASTQRLVSVREMSLDVNSSRRLPPAPPSRHAAHLTSPQILSFPPNPSSSISN